jgi:hypothetical protein
VTHQFEEKVEEILPVLINRLHAKKILTADLSGLRDKTDKYMGTDPWILAKLANA